MDIDFIRGFLKVAQEGAEVVAPESESSGSLITCIGDCIYAQNPEKQCRLANVTLIMDQETGAFSCGQYTSNAEQMAGQQVPVQNQQAQPLAQTQPQQEARTQAQAR